MSRRRHRSRPSSRPSGRVDDRRHQVLGAGRGGWRSAASARRAARSRAAPRTPRTRVDLLLLELGVDAQDRDRLLVRDRVAVDADDDALPRPRPPAGSGTTPSAISRCGMFCSIAATMPPSSSIRSEQLVGLGLEPVRQRLDVVRAAERIDRVDDAGLVRDHLLRPQREPAPRPRSAARAPRRRSSCAATACRRERPPAPRSRSVRRSPVGCCHVSDTPAVWVWKRISSERSSLAP